MNQQCSRSGKEALYARVEILQKNREHCGQCHLHVNDKSRGPLLEGQVAKWQGWGNRSYWLNAMEYCRQEYHILWSCSHCLNCVYLNHSSSPGMTAVSGCLEATSAAQSLSARRSQRERQRTQLLTDSEQRAGSYFGCKRNILPSVCGSDSSLCWASICTHQYTHWSWEK